jgi:hypothetical protein
MRASFLCLLALAVGCASPPAAEKQSRVYYFLGVDCPISNAYAPEIQRIQHNYSTFEHRIIYPLPHEEADAITRHAQEFGFHCEFRHDHDLSEARRLGATHTPEVIVEDTHGRIVYQGRIDDRYPRPGGPRREHPTQRDLREALDDLLAGRAVRVPRTQPVGCDIDLEALP